MSYKRPESIGSDLREIQWSGADVTAARRYRVLAVGHRQLEQDESPPHAAQREVMEEVGIDIEAEHLPLFDCQRCVEFELFVHLRHRYAPGTTRNKEHWFCLALPEERDPVITEHHAYQWLEAAEAVKLTSHGAISRRLKSS